MCLFPFHFSSCVRIARHGRGILRRASDRELRLRRLTGITDGVECHPVYARRQNAEREPNVAEEISCSRGTVHSKSTSTPTVKIAACSNNMAPE